MSTPRLVAAPDPQPQSTAIAPAWHTAGVLLLLAGMVALGLHARSGDLINQGHNRLVGYIITMAAEWLIVGFIVLGARWGGASFRILVGNFAPKARTILRDLGIAVVYLLVAQIVLGITTAVVGHLIHSNPNAVLKNLLPHTAIEDAAYLLLALTAGICEETIFRGYLQRQFTAWTASAAAGLTLQGILFGAAHAYQGPGMMIVIAVYGCMFGSLALWRKSLRPGMMAHFLQDAVGGLLLAKFLPK
jgi:membrane protease YdiL (CAAX protease family)